MGNRTASEAIGPGGDSEAAALAAGGSLWPERLGDYQILRVIG